jgi:hypothetical protein
VYWVHIEFVYGRLSILRKQDMSISGASAGLLAIFLAMLALSRTRTHMKGKAARPWLGVPARAGAGEPH